jgi:hypothetical protein
MLTSALRCRSDVRSGRGRGRTTHNPGVRFLVQVFGIRQIDVNEYRLEVDQPLKFSTQSALPRHVSLRVESIENLSYRVSFNSFP